MVGIGHLAFDFGHLVYSWVMLLALGIWHGAYIGFVIGHVAFGFGHSELGIQH